MKLHRPFKISARLLPAVEVGDSWISFEPQTNEVCVDTPDFEEIITDFRPGRAHDIQECFRDILGFMSWYGESPKESPFSKQLTEWCADNQDELSSLQCDIEETENLIEEN